MSPATTHFSTYSSPLEIDRRVFLNGYHSAMSNVHRLSSTCAIFSVLRVLLFLVVPTMFCLSDEEIIVNLATKENSKLVPLLQNHIQPIKLIICVQLECIQSKTALSSNATSCSEVQAWQLAKNHSIHFVSSWRYWKWCPKFQANSVICLILFVIEKDASSFYIASDFSHPDLADKQSTGIFTCIFIHLPSKRHNDCKPSHTDYVFPFVA